MRTLTVASFTLFSATALGQNLVPNGSFEEYTTCPPTIGYIEYATGWVNYRQSPDFYHRCNTGALAGVPLNSCGYQQPAEGDGYAGVFTFSAGNSLIREYMGVQLQTPLVPGVPIHLAFKVAAGGFGSSAINSARYTCKGVSMKFFIEAPFTPLEWLEYLYPSEVALALTEVPSDTSTWYTVQGVYTPDSAYTHLLLGNFRPDSLSSPTQLDSTGFANTDNAYAFIDEVCVSYDAATCGIVQSVRDYGLPRVVRVSSPFIQELTVSLFAPPVGLLQYLIIDSSGRSICDGTVTESNSTLRINLPEFSAGLYLLSLSDRSGPYPAQRVVRESP